MLHTAARLTANSPMIPKVLGLIQTSFAYMDGRIDPPSSMYNLTLDAVKTNHVRGGMGYWRRPFGLCFSKREGRLSLYRQACVVPSRAGIRACQIPDQTGRVTGTCAWPGRVRTLSEN